MRVGKKQPNVPTVFTTCSGTYGAMGRQTTIISVTPKAP